MNGEIKKESLQLVFIVAGVVLERDGKFLLVQERKESAYGQWNLPSGRVEEGESIEGAAIREAMEEVGFEVELVRRLGVIHASIDSPVLHAFEAKITGGELQFDAEELQDAKWFTREELNDLDLRNPEYILGAIDMLVT